jgi:two-component system, cell cycle response regulator
MSESFNIILLVEDDDNDIIITKRKIARSSLIINQIIVTQTLKETTELLNKQVIDAVILDLNLPDSFGLDTLISVRKMYDGIIIVLTSIDDELIGVEAIRQGADDYLVKNEITERNLARSIYQSIMRRKINAIKETTKSSITKLQNMPSII